SLRRLGRVGFVDCRRPAPEQVQTLVGLRTGLSGVREDREPGGERRDHPAGLQVFNERDVDAAVGTWHEDGEFAPAMAGAVEGKTYRGHAELRRYFDDLFGSFSDVHVEDPELRDLGDRVLILYRLIVHGRDSDLT